MRDCHWRQSELTGKITDKREKKEKEMIRGILADIPTGGLGINRFEIVQEGPRKGCFTDETLIARDAYYTAVKREAVLLAAGRHVLEVMSVLYKDVYPLDGIDQEVIFLASENNVDLVISLKEFETPRLGSRHNIRVGVVIELTVAEGGRITNCTFLKRVDP